MWSRKHIACCECGDTKYEHVGRGLCSLCYYRSYSAKNDEKLTQYKRDWYVAHHAESLVQHKINRENRHFSGLREAVLVRDNHMCCRCKKTTTLIVHHIDGNGRGSDTPNNTLENLQTLCRGCHFLCHFHPNLFSTPPSPQLNKHGRWSIKHDSCIICGTVYSQHAAKGLCMACYSKQTAKKQNNRKK